VTLNRRAFVVAAAISVATVVALVAYLVIGGLLISLAGGVALTAKRSCGRMGTMLSVGLGLLVGPVVYLVLAGVVYLVELNS
jgi:hypothetical protein